ncbi:hypothetical protein BKA70DRAFT_1032109, partial [Coprinopsis sp. MPI-PUGE-AT-0042]
KNNLYCIPRHCLTSQSEVFEGMFLLDGQGEGETEDQPIVLEGYRSQDFECLLRILLPEPMSEPPKSLAKGEWISVLKLASTWQMSKVRKLAIDNLSELEMTPIEKIALGREFRVADWVSSGAKSLATLKEDFPLQEVANVLGWETTARILCLRE